jgi:hypothetical protein
VYGQKRERGEEETTKVQNSTSLKDERQTERERKFRERERENQEIPWLRPLFGIQDEGIARNILTSSMLLATLATGVCGGGGGGRE